MKTITAYLKKNRISDSLRKSPRALSGKLANITYITALVFFIVKTMFGNSYLDTLQSLPVTVTGFVTFVNEYLACILLIALMLDVFANSLSWRRLIAALVLGLLTQSIWIINHDIEVLSFFWFVVAFPSRLSLRLLARCCWVSLLVCIVITISCFAADLITEHVQDQHGVVRHSLGFTWPNILSLYTTSAVIAFTYDFFNCWKFRYYAITLTVLVVAFIVANGRVSFICGFLVITFAMIWSHKGKLSTIFKKTASPLYYLAIWLTPICAAACLIITVVSTYEPQAHDFFYPFLDVRLDCAEKFFAQYGFGLLGQNVTVVTWREAVSTGVPWSNVDISYVRFALMYGILFLACFVVLNCLNGLYAKRTNNIALACIIAIMAIFGITEHITLNPAFNITVLSIGKMLSSGKPLNCQHARKEGLHAKVAIENR